MPEANCGYQTRMVICNISKATSKERNIRQLYPLLCLNLDLSPTLNQHVIAPCPIHDDLATQHRVTHLHHPSPLIWTLHLLEVRVRQEDSPNNKLPIFDINEVADIVCVLSKYEDAGVHDFCHGSSKGEGQGDDPGPEGT